MSAVIDGILMKYHIDQGMTTWYIIQTFYPYGIDHDFVLIKLSVGSLNIAIKNYPVQPNPALKALMHKDLTTFWKNRLKILLLFSK